MPSLLKKFWSSRRAATAVALAIMFVPMVIAASAAVDFARIASARALMQAAVDGAAEAGANAYQISENYTEANNVTQSTYYGTATQLGSFVSNLTPTFGVYCSSQGSAAQCDTGTDSGALSGNCPSAFATTQEYCVVATATATLKNSLFAWLIPPEALTVQSVSTTLFPLINNHNFNHTNVGFGSDYSGIYAYVVPKDTNGNPIYNSVPAPNSNCEGSGYGPLGLEPTTVYATTTSSVCNYLLIGTNLGGSGAGQLSFNVIDAIAFTFVNFSGGTITTGTSDLDTTTFNSSNGASTINSGNATSTQFTSELYYQGAYNATGVTAASLTGVPAANYVAKCSGGLPSGCTTTGTVGISYSPANLYGNCPAHNLYGSINAYPNAAVGTNYVPLQDSFNTYSTAFEYLGYPPTYPTNHQLIPFLGPETSDTITKTTKTPTGGNNSTTSTNTLTYSAQVVCPQWPTTGTLISATAPAGTYSFTPTGYSTASSPAVQIYATYFPNLKYSDGVSTDIFPPTVAGCTPATNATDGLVTPLTDDPWWGWSPSNAAALDPGGAAENPPAGVNDTNCASAVLNSAHTGITTTMNNVQSATYSNCAFSAQDLGTAVPTSGGNPLLPDYWLYTVNPTGFSTGVTGNPSGITAMIPVYDNTTYTIPAPPETPSSSGLTVVVGNGSNGVAVGYDKITNSNAAGHVPTTISVVSNGDSTYTVTEPPGYGTDAYPPEDTSHQCYNPAANGLSGTTMTTAGFTNADTTPATPIDPFENPQLGVISCRSNPPHSFGLYWNDLGAWATPPHYNDDLGYANAITEFTCPTPGNAGGGPSTLSG